MLDDIRPPEPQSTAARSSIFPRTTTSGSPRIRASKRRRWRRSSSSAWARARCAPSPGRWRFTWSSSGGSRSSRRPRRLSFFRAASPRTPAPSPRSSTKEDFVISDELNHASIIDGARLSRAINQGLSASRRGCGTSHPAQTCRLRARKLLITDGVFSMDGDLGALPELCGLAEEYGCIMMVDDAHASGVFGRTGAAPIDHFGLHGRVDVQVGTLSKAVGAPRRVRRGQQKPDRVPPSSRTAVPLLDIPSAVSGGYVPCCAGCPS